MVRGWGWIWWLYLRSLCQFDITDHMGKWAPELYKALIGPHQSFRPFLCVLIEVPGVPSKIRNSSV